MKTKLMIALFSTLLLGACQNSQWVWIQKT